MKVIRLDELSRTVDKLVQAAVEKVIAAKLKSGREALGPSAEPLTSEASPPSQHGRNSRGDMSFSQVPMAQG